MKELVTSKLKYLTYTYDFEVCAHIREISGKLDIDLRELTDRLSNVNQSLEKTTEDNYFDYLKSLLYKISQNGASQNRHQCIHSKYTTIIFHTHPLSAYSYPSLEDIIKVCKNSKIAYSVIATTWGIWIINKNTANLDSREQLENYLTHYLDKLGLVLRKKMELTINDELFINEMVDKIKKTGIDLQFFNWDQPVFIKI